MKIVSKAVRFVHSCRSGIDISDSARLSPFVNLDRRFAGRISIGARSSIGFGAILAPYGGHVTIGDDCSVNPYCVLYGHGGLTISNFVRIAAHTVVIPANHGFGDRRIPISKQPLKASGVFIEDDVWIGTGVSILDGVRLAEGCVIGAGSVVTKSTEPYGIYVGNPARFLKFR